MTKQDLKENSKKRTKNFRFEQDLILKLDKAAKSQLISDTEFVKQAIIEKIFRQSIEENLQFNIDLSDLKTLMQDSEKKIENIIVRLTDRQDNLEYKLNSKIDHMTKILSAMIEGMILVPSKNSENLIVDRSKFLKTAILRLFESTNKIRENEIFAKIANGTYHLDEIKEVLYSLEDQGILTRKIDLWIKSEGE